MLRATQALLPFAAIVAIDGVCAHRAWTSTTEAIILGLLSLALTLFIAGAAVFVTRGFARVAPRYASLAPFATVAPVLVLIERELAQGRIIRTSLGFAAPLAIAAALGLATFLIFVLARRGASRVLLLLALAFIAGNAALPLRVVPVLHVLCFVIGIGCSIAQVAALRVEIRSSALVIATLAAGIVSVGALHTSSNVRFVAHEQLPGTNVVLSFGVEQEAHPGSRSASLGTAPLDASLSDAHLVLITIDALRADGLGSYGATRATPNLDALAARAQRYARAYAQAPQTAYSLSSLLTSTPPGQLAAAPPTITEVLRQHRWFTEAWYPDGLFFDGRGALRRYADERFGFAWTDTRTQDARGVTDSVLDRIAKLKAEGEPRSFLWVHYFDPHEPYDDHPGVTHGTSARARYEGEIAYVDANIGRLFAALDGLLRPVIIVVTADHGEEHGEHGGYYHGSSVYEEQIRVPLLLVVPGQAPRVIDRPVELLDIVPTVTSLLGVPMATIGHGLLQPTDPDDPSPDAHASVHTKRMLVRGQYKLIHDIRREFDELYDLAEDPGEQHNVFDQRRAIAAPMHAALESWFGLSTPSELVRTLEDVHADPLARAAAASELGRRATGDGREALARAINDADSRVATASVLSLGELHDPRSRPALLGLLDDPDVALQAAILLGRAGETRALPKLLDALAGGIDVDLERTAIHVIGAIGDEAAARTLADHLVDLRTRSEMYLAIGRIAARTPAAHLERLLLDHLRDEPYEDARGHLVWGLSLAATGEETKPLVALSRATTWPIALEGLTRSRRFPSELVGGVDLAPGREALDQGLHDCKRAPTLTLRQWTGATSCRMRSSALLHLFVPRSRAASLIFRARAERPTKLELSVGRTVIATVELGARYTETSIPIAGGLLASAHGQLALHALTDDANVELDYALLLPATLPP